MKKIKQIVIIVFFMLFLFISNLKADTAQTGMRTISSVELVADMGAGWNLGNTLDAETNDETGWGNPKTTKAMIDELHNRGFKTIRLPVTWRFHLGGAPEYVIEKAWLDRVEEVANYAFDNDMYVIVNIHHDDPWIIPTYEKAPEVNEKLIKVWTQIANRFKKYGDYLIFETLNEPRYEGSPEEWSGGTAEGRDVVNQYQKTCVDAIRATGGNNAKRHLMVSTYAAAGYGDALKDFKIPNNDERVIVSIHNYSPFDFTLQEGGRSNWGSAADKAALSADMDNLYNKFVLNDRAVVLGEWCATNRNNLADREIYYKCFMRTALERELRPVYWDIGASNGSGLLDRNKLTWFFPTLVDAIIETVREFDCPEIVMTPYLKKNLDEYSQTDKATIEIGDDLILKVDCSGNGDLTWENPDGTLSSGNELTINNVQLGDIGVYKFSVVNENSCKGNVYFNIDLDDEGLVKYEAENWFAQSGIQTESCSDVGNGENIGFIENKDWSTYKVEIDESGVYNFMARVATGAEGGDVELSIDGNVIGNVTVSPDLSYGWQDWYTTTPIEVELQEGTHELKFAFSGDGVYLFNMNWFELLFNRSLIATAVNDLPTGLSDHLMCYQTEEGTIIKYGLDKRSRVSVSILTVSGVVIEKILSNQIQNSGNYICKWDGNSNGRLVNGIYLIVLECESRKEVKKVVLVR